METKCSEKCIKWQTVNISKSVMFAFLMPRGAVVTPTVWLSRKEGTAKR